MNLRKTIKEIELILGYTFKIKKNLTNSLIHPSFYKYKKGKLINKVNEFERLEFLGDRVLGITIAFLIFKKFINFDEGNLSKKLSFLVQRDFLYKIALELKLDEILQYSHKKENIRMNKSIMADTVESLIGGIFIDRGYTSAYNFIKMIWDPYLDLHESNEQDSKTRLQEISQQRFKVLPKYKLLKKNGLSHLPTFTVSLKFPKIKSVKASGKSIKEAEKNAAKLVLDLISAK